MSPLRLDRGREPRPELPGLRRFPVQSQTDAEMSAAESRETTLRRELDAERHRNRHLILLTRTLADDCSRLAVENYELRYGRRYGIPGKGLSPDNALGLSTRSPQGL